ncbi:MAG: glycerophosphodiester phosphodiesterase [Candidatus Villigracilaceae bacterium]
MWSELPRPIVFAHRGASAQAPENTLAAFELAARQGAPAIELDAKLSADGQVIVMHDARVDRTTDGKGRVCDLSLTALRELDAGSWFSEQYRGERIPTLGEVFETLGKRLFINVELTNYTTPHDALVEKVTELVKAFGLQSQVIFSSFLPHNLVQAAKRLPEVPRGLLASPRLMGMWARSFGFAFGDYQALHPFVGDVTLQQIARVHRLRRRIHVWTVNAESDLRRLFAWGVDGVFTDDPALALRLLQESA